ncbi:MAG: hypothetical protein HOV81_10885 [Kofleriaceae bacterium]|nr:hypothetical protein [Kofleriaceae bacterium]
MRRTLLSLCFVAASSLAAAADPAPVAKPAPAPVAQGDAVDFIADAKLLYRIAACGGTTALDPKLEKIVAAHCKAITEKLDAFRAQYFDKNRTWFDKVVPKDVPKTVVYPFGGGDLLSALVAFPEATEVTTISLELAGDPRRLKTLAPRSVQTSLNALRGEIGGLISVGSNTSENLSNGQRNDLPAQVSSFLLGLVAGGYEPVSMRYFSLDDAGNIHYLTQAEIDAADKQAKIRQAKEAKLAAKDPEYKASSHLKGDWLSPNFSLAFSNVEIQYRKIGETAVRVHRHIAWNLGDPYLKKNPQLIRHLEKKGQVTMLVKGASYLLWRPDFALIRGYILDHLKWMLSDSTGVPVKYAKGAGMVQETYGRYDGAFLDGVQATAHDDEFRELWKSQKKRPLPFRFGYVDINKQAHLLVTRPKS